MLKDDPQHPSRMGFDEHCFFGWHEGPRYWEPLLWQNGSIREDVAHRFGPNVYVEFLLDFMKRHKGGPFFAYYPMALSHAVSDDLSPHPPHGPEGRYMTYAEISSITNSADIALSARLNCGTSVITFSGQVDAQMPHCRVINPCGTVFFTHLFGVVL